MRPAILRCVRWIPKLWRYRRSGSSPRSLPRLRPACIASLWVARLDVALAAVVADAAAVVVERRLRTPVPHRLMQRLPRRLRQRQDVVAVDVAAVAAEAVDVAAVAACSPAHTPCG